MTQPTLRIRDVLIRTKLNEANTANAEIGLVIKSEALNPRTSRIHYELLNPAGERITGGTQTITLDMRQEDTIRFLTAIPDTLLWAPEHPVSCTLQLKTQHEGRYVEYIELPVGFREIAVDRTGQMLLNETERQLRACEVSPEISTTEIAALREKGYNTLKLKAGTIRSGLYADCNRMGHARHRASPHRHKQKRPIAPQRRQSVERPTLAGTLHRTDRRQLPHIETPSVSHRIRTG